MLIYECFGPNGQRLTIEAASQYAAKCEAVRQMKVKPNKAHLVSAHLVEKDGAAVIHVADQ